MQFDDIRIEKYGNRYVLYNSHNYRVLVVDLPNTEQLFLDSKTLAIFAKTISIRWKQTQASKDIKLTSFDYSGMGVMQITSNAYAIYLPNGQQVALMTVPQDGRFLEDDACLKVLCKGLAYRYRINKGK